MLVYLKGMSSVYIEHLIDFLYNGETFISKEELNGFIETAKELKVKGLDGKLVRTRELVEEQPNGEKDFANTRGSENENLNSSELSDNDVEEQVSNKEFDETIVKIKKETVQPITNKEILLPVHEMIEKIEGVWTCKVCGKRSTTNSEIRNHAETHISGMSFSCEICGKTFPTRRSRWSHISDIHSKLFSCNICGKSGMNRKANYHHKIINHSQLFSCDMCEESGMNRSAYGDHKRRKHKTSFSEK